jgi:hypothetical protein
VGLNNTVWQAMNTKAIIGAFIGFAGICVAVTGLTKCVEFAAVSLSMLGAPSAAESAPYLALQLAALAAPMTQVSLGVALFLGCRGLGGALARQIKIADREAMGGVAVHDLLFVGCAILGLFLVITPIGDLLALALAAFRVSAGSHESLWSLFWSGQFMRPGELTRYGAEAVTAAIGVVLVTRGGAVAAWIIGKKQGQPCDAANADSAQGSR